MLESGGGDSAYERGGDANRKLWIKPPPPPRVLEQPTPIATQPVNAALSPHSSPLGLNGEEHAP